MVVHYQTGGCGGGNNCFQYDSRLIGAVVYHKDMAKADTLYKWSVQKNPWESQLSVQQHTKSLYRNQIMQYPGKMKNFHDLSQIPTSFEDEFHTEMSL